MFRKLLSAFFNTVVAWLIPSHGKRIVLLTSLFGCLTKQKEVDEETLAKLNKALHLTEGVGNDEILTIPLKLQSLIWDGKEIELLQNQSVTKQDLEQVYKLVPKSLQYTQWQNDIEKLFKTIPQLSPN